VNNEKSSSKSAGAGLLVAITASLCCITPVLALISGASGIAASFSWLEPFRPFLIGITVLVLGFAWYQKLRPKKAEVECDCETDEKKPFMQSKMFLGLVTVFAMIMLAFPYYSYIFYPDINKDAVAENVSTVKQINLEIAGMTCTSCEEHIDHSAMEVPGVFKAESDYTTGNATIQYDQSVSSAQDVINAINATGYKVVSSNVTDPQPSQVKLTLGNGEVKQVVLPVAGMTCTSCVEHINYEVSKVAGVIDTDASYEKGQAVVKYDPAKTSEQAIVDAINATGYKVEEKTSRE